MFLGSVDLWVFLKFGKIFVFSDIFSALPTLLETSVELILSYQQASPAHGCAFHVCDSFSLSLSFQIISIAVSSSPLIFSSAVSKSLIIPSSLFSSQTL